MSPLGRLYSAKKERYIEKTASASKPPDIQNFNGPLYTIHDDIAKCGCEKSCDKSSHANYVEIVFASP